MDKKGLNASILGSDSQDSDELVPPGTLAFDSTKTLGKTPQDHGSPSISTPALGTPKLLPSAKGVENAKKRLRAFSIQKKTPITPVSVMKPTTTAGSTTVLIGKLSGVKVAAPKPEEDPLKKLPKPPKPGSNKKGLNEYSDIQKKTLAEIEDMKRKMELVELGIPLGLICPSTNSDKAMPTKAMPPIKTFLDEAKVDELIREAKKAKAEGKEFKFDYQKLLPDYDNPFQRKREEQAPEDKKMDKEDRRNKSDRGYHKDKGRRRSDKYDSRKHYDYRTDDRSKYKDKSKEREEKSKDRDEKSRDRDQKIIDKIEKKEDKEKQTNKSSIKDTKETDVNLNDYLVCDSWSLDNDDKTSSSSPKVEEKTQKTPVSALKETKVHKDPMDQLRESIVKKKNDIKQPIKTDSPISMSIKKIPKLQPVIDSFKYEIDPNEDDVLDMFDEDADLEKYANYKPKKPILYDSPVDIKLYDQDSKDLSMDGMNDDNFLESVINEIKQEDLSEDGSQEKGLVEYDISPNNEEPSYNAEYQLTPELENVKDAQASQRSDFSDSSKYESGYRSSESGYKSIESGYKLSERSYKSSERGYKTNESRYKSTDRSYKSSDSGYKSTDSRHSSDSLRLSIDKELDYSMGDKMSKETLESLDTWSFVLKICQPLLFRHDKNKCYKETTVVPKVWYTENPKICQCVKDRSVVYEELEMCKMSLVDRVYGCDQIPEEASAPHRSWYPPLPACVCPAGPLRPARDWSSEVSRLSVSQTTPDDMSLDREYQRFMDSVWPEVSDTKSVETSRSTTPVRQQESRKKKNLTEAQKEVEDKRSAKKIKLDEDWSEDFELELELEKGGKKLKAEKEKRKRKLSSSSISSGSSEDEMRKKKRLKKKTGKMSKSKAKRRRLEKKYLKKLKEKEKRKKKQNKTEKFDEDSDGEEEQREIKRKERKNLKKMKQQKLKKKEQKKKKAKAKSSSSSESSSSSDSDSSADSDTDDKKSKKARKRDVETKKKKRKDKKKKRKQSTSDSTQSEDLFDVNVLNNIKTERLTDDEKCQKKLMDQDFSPRRQLKPRQEIINVKELQNDLVTNSIHIKKEVEEERTKEVEEQRTKEMEEERTKEMEEERTKEMEEERTKEMEEERIKKMEEERTKEMEEERTKKVEEERTKEISEQSSKVDTSDKIESKSVGETIIENKSNKVEFKEPQEVDQTASQIRSVVDESNLSQCSSQESVCSVKERSAYEKDESHLRPSSQNSNYSFNDVINASQSGFYHKSLDANVECEEKFVDNYEQGNYEMYEQLAMAYQSDVANQSICPEAAVAGEAGASQRIETVVRARSRGEIKCDWRAGDSTPAHAHRPSRWGLKPNDVNIVLTGEGASYTGATSEGATSEGARGTQQVYRIQSIANRNECSMSYDEAYMDMYGASDRLQYGDCFAESVAECEPNIAECAPNPAESELTAPAQTDADKRTSLDARIDRALRDTVLGVVAKEPDADADKDGPEKGILVTKPGGGEAGRGAKRVSFADGYKPGQDSDVEEPPIKKKKKVRRYGCAWPCPASHPDHVPLWDALPPPPPPPGSPPPVAPAAPPLHLLRAPPPRVDNPLLPTPAHHHLQQKYEANTLAGFMPPEPPPGIITFP